MGRIIVALAAIALALLFLHEAQSYASAAARLPGLLGWLVIFLGLMVIAQVFLTWSRERANGTLTLIPAMNWRAISIGVAFAALVMLYGWGILHLGHLVATPLFLLIPLVVMRPVGWTGAAITTIVVTGVIWAVFIHLLNLPLPLYPGA